MIINFIKCLVSPRLYRIHRSSTGRSYEYQPNDLESYCDAAVKWFRFFKSFTYYTSPVIFVFLYQRGTLHSVEGWTWLIKFTTAVVLLHATSCFFRAIGRYVNHEYMAFMDVLDLAKKNWNAEIRRKLSSYDFEFFDWPADFDVRLNSERKGRSKQMIEPKSRTTEGPFWSVLPCKFLGYLAVNSFGRRMIYPGATALQYLMAPALNQGRAKLVEEKNGKRAKVVTTDGNSIDTMFIDRRNTLGEPANDTLVICCEGNAGFYEIGCTATPLEAGYSVLGWNHPGFAGSTGIPFPSTEQNAIDAVMQYAIVKLGFPPESIAIFAWSIGGYTATWAAMNYPDLKYLVLDATFDSIEPLALMRMPQSWNNLVLLALRSYMNLNNVEHLTRYPGPVLLIRRTKDEIITTGEPGRVEFNRGNDLLIKLLHHRYPKIVNEETIEILSQYLSKEKYGHLAMLAEKGVDDDVCNSIFRSYILEHSNSFPMQLGEDLNTETKIQLTLFLASQYLDDFDATHCVPLPGRHFRTPWMSEL